MKSYPLTEMLAKIVELMENDPLISAPLISKHTGLTAYQCDNYLKALKIFEVIERVGPAKGGHWLVKPPKHLPKK
jgi:ATP-dependent DNA helicase RecG